MSSLEIWCNSCCCILSYPTDSPQQIPKYNPQIPKSRKYHGKLVSGFLSLSEEIPSLSLAVVFPLSTILLLLPMQFSNCVRCGLLLQYPSPPRDVGTVEFCETSLRNSNLRTLWREGAESLVQFDVASLSLVCPGTAAASCQARCLSWNLLEESLWLHISGVIPRCGDVGLGFVHERGRGHRKRK